MQMSPTEWASEQIYALEAEAEVLEDSCEAGTALWVGMLRINKSEEQQMQVEEMCMLWYMSRWISNEYNRKNTWVADVRNKMRVNTRLWLLGM